MYGLTSFLSVLWYTVAGWFGAGRNEAHAVTLFDGDSQAHGEFSSDECMPSDEDDAKYGGFNLDCDVRYTHPHGWGFDTRY